jgi:hypothetical protein
MESVGDGFKLGGAYDRILVPKCFMGLNVSLGWCSIRSEMLCFLLKKKSQIKLKLKHDHNPSYFLTFVVFFRTVKLPRKSRNFHCVAGQSSVGFV